MTKTIETKIRETKESTPDTVILEGWLELQAANDAVKGVRVFKRNSIGKWARCYEMEPPFGEDLETLFRSRGDGDYKFISHGEKGAILSERVETVEGYGPGKESKSVTTTDPDDDEDAGLDEMMTLMRKNLRFNMLRKNLRDLEDDRTPPQIDDDNRFTMKEAMQLFTQMVAALRPQQDDTLKTLLPLLFQKVMASEPTDKMIDSFIKIVELQERLRGGGDMGMDGVPGWMQALLVGMNTPIGQNLARALVARGAPTGPHPAMPPAPPSTTEPAKPAPESKAESVATAATEVTGQPPGPIIEAYQLFQEKITPLLKAAARRGSKSFELYGDLIDETLPGFLDRWLAFENFEDAARLLANSDPEWTTDPVLTQWLSECWKELKEGGDREEPDDD